MSAVRKTTSERDVDYEGGERRGPARSGKALEGEILPPGEEMAGDLLMEMPSAVQVSQLLVESQRRHDLERRLATLAIEYDRCLASLQTLIRRYDSLQAECEASRPAIHIQALVPSLLRTALRLARDQVRAEYPELDTIAGAS
jgi:hypothetical protein